MGGGRWKQSRDEEALASKQDRFWAGEQNLV